MKQRVEVKPDDVPGSHLYVIYVDHNRVGQPCEHFQAAEVCEWLNDGGLNALCRFMVETNEE